MSTFLRALSKIGLVELSETEQDRIKQQRGKTTPPSTPSAVPKSASSAEDELERLLRETQDAIDATDEPGPSSPSPAAPPRATASQGTGGLDARTLAEIYGAAGIPEVPFTVEKLLKVLDGLKALPPASRKAAVLALDAADDHWSITDVILDAQRKGRALRGEQERLSQALSAAEAQAQQDMADSERYQQEATATIRQQIAELEAMLQAEMQQVTEQKAAIRSQLAQAHESVQRAQAALSQEIARISEVPLTFSDTPTS